MKKIGNPNYINILIQIDGQTVDTIKFLRWGTGCHKPKDLALAASERVKGRLLELAKEEANFQI